MKALVNAFLSEPILALGVLQGVATGLAAEGIIATWLGVVIVAAILPFQRHFVTPDKA